MVQPQKVLELEFTVLEFFPDHVISKPREGEVLEGKQVADLMEICSDYYKNKDFVYLSYRVNEYNVNPTVYLDLEKTKNLKGIAVVSSKSSSLNMARFEKKFCKLPYEIFTDLKAARVWVQELLKNKKADL